MGVFVFLLVLRLFGERVVYVVVVYWDGGRSFVEILRFLLGLSDYR